MVMVFGRKITDEYEQEDCNGFGINRHYNENRELYHQWAKECFGDELKKRLNNETFEEIEKFMIARKAGKVLGYSKTPLDPEFTKLLKYHEAEGKPNEKYLRELMGMVAVEDGDEKKSRLQRILKA